MHQVHILPLDVTIEAAEGASIMEAANAQGLYWPTTCGGQGECTTCAGVVVSGGEHLSEMGRSERRSLLENRGAATLSKPIRLCCQARVYGDVEVQKPGVR
jgi:ferredoxin, 2Fe-2S